MNTHRPHIPTAKYTPAPSHLIPQSQSVLEKREVDVTPPPSSRQQTQTSGKAAPRDKTPVKKQPAPVKKSKSPEKVIAKRSASPVKAVEKKRDEKGKRKEDEKKAKKEATKEKKAPASASTERKTSPSKQTAVKGKAAAV